MKIHLTVLLLATTSAGANIFDPSEDTRETSGRRRDKPGPNPHAKEQAHGRKRGKTGRLSRAALVADCDAPVDVEAFPGETSGPVTFRAAKGGACARGKVYAGDSSDGRRHLTCVSRRRRAARRGRGRGVSSFACTMTDDEDGSVIDIAPDGDGETVSTLRRPEDFGPELAVYPDEDEDEDDPAADGARRLGPAVVPASEQRGPDAARSLQWNSVIDVLALWTSAAECRNSGLSVGCTRTARTEANIRAKIDLANQETNNAYANSGVRARLELVHAAHVDYVESASDEFDVAISALRNQGDGLMDEAHTLRRRHGADVVALLIDGNDYCGLGYVGPRYDLMFSVTAWNCATGNYVWAHEIGHNQGCKHDRGTENQCRGGGYNYGWRDPGGAFRTIMAYNCQTDECDRNDSNFCRRVGYFSNDVLTYNGQALGSSSNNCARQINEAAPTIARYRSRCLANCYQARTRNDCNCSGDCIWISVDNFCEAKWTGPSPPTPRPVAGPGPPTPRPVAGPGPPTRRPVTPPIGSGRCSDYTNQRECNGMRMIQGCYWNRGRCIQGLIP